MFNLSNIGFGFQTLVLGLLVVFLALAIIWLAVSLIGMAFKRKNGSAEKKSSAKPAPAVQEVPVVLADTPVSVSGEDSAALIAVITAAICAAEDKPLGSFRVVSFKKR